MRAVMVNNPGGPEALEILEVPIPQVSPHEVLIRISAAGLNRTDILQRKGNANLPPGATEVLGLEVSGTIHKLGSECTEFEVDQEVVALVDSGGYAEYVNVPVAQVALKPALIGLLEAGGLAEIAATVVLNVLMLGRFRRSESVLIHGGTGGVGSFAIQLVKALGGQVIVTAGSAEKCAFARELGADVAINYREQDFAEVVESLGGVDIILDTVAGPYLEGNLRALKLNGRMITIGRQGGSVGTLNFAALMKKKLTLSGSLLRDRTPSEKAEVIAETVKHVWPLVESGKIKLITDRVFGLTEVIDAHTYFDAGIHRGKILLNCEN